MTSERLTQFVSRSVSPRRLRFFADIEGAYAFLMPKAVVWLLEMPTTANVAAPVVVSFLVLQGVAQRVNYP